MRCSGGFTKSSRKGARESNRDGHKIELGAHAGLEVRRERLSMIHYLVHEGFASGEVEALIEAKQR